MCGDEKRRRRPCSDGGDELRACSRIDARYEFLVVDVPAARLARRAFESGRCRSLAVNECNSGPGRRPRPARPDPSRVAAGGFRGRGRRRLPRSVPKRPKRIPDDLVRRDGGAARQDERKRSLTCKPRAGGDGIHATGLVAPYLAVAPCGGAGHRCRQRPAAATKVRRAHGFATTDEAEWSGWPRAKVVRWLRQLAVLLPCEHCRIHFGQMLTADLRSRRRPLVAKEEVG